MIVQHGLVAVHHLPASCSALADDLNHRAPVQTRLVREMQRLTQALNQPRNGNLVAHLGHLPRTAVANPTTDPGIGINDGFCLVIGGLIATTHDGQHPVLGTSLPA